MDIEDVEAAKRDWLREHGPLTIAHVLDDPPPFHTKVTDWGERPYWYPDGRKIAFIGSNYGDAYEYDLDTEAITNLTEHGEHHAFLRVLVMFNGDYLLVGPKEFKDRITSRIRESQIWWMPADRSAPPTPLDDTYIQEGLAVSWIAPRIAYLQGYHQRPELPKFTYQIHVRDLEYGADGRPHLGPDRVAYTDHHRHEGDLEHQMERRSGDGVQRGVE